MIRPEMAKKFIDQITEYTEYNINIMDESGVIIASRDEKRIGTGPITKRLTGLSGEVRKSLS